jgi:hypothetical protein
MTRDNADDDRSMSEKSPLTPAETGLLQSLFKRFRQVTGADPFTSTIPRMPVADAVRRLLEPYPHVIMEMVNPHSLHPRASIDLTVWCWSPSLHRMLCRWPLEVATADVSGAPLRQSQMDEQVAKALAPRLALQRLRIRRAEALGIKEPLFLGSEGDAATDPAAAPIDHVAVDRHLLSIVHQAASQGEDDAACDREQMLRQLRYDIACAHSADSQTGDLARGTNHLRHTPTIVTDVRLADGSTAGMLRPTHAISTRGVVTAFDGHGLIILAGLPETALSAATGRPLRELIETGTALDSRIILDTRQTDAGVAVMLPPDLVRIGDLPDRRVTALDVRAMPAYPGSIRR